MTIPYQFLSHLNNEPSMKKNQSTPIQKKNLDLPVPVWILIFRNELYLTLYRSLNLII